MKKLLLTLIAAFACISLYADGVVYFTNPNNWATPYVWIWNSTTNTNFTGGEWPGKAMTQDGDKWKYEWSGSGTPTNIIFNNKGASGQQTGDLTFTDGATYDMNGPIGAQTYDHEMCLFKNTKNWGTPRIYTFSPAIGNSGSWPGQELTYVSGSGANAIYKWVVTTTDPTPPNVGSFIFNGGTDSTKTGDLTGFQVGATYLGDGSIEGQEQIITYYLLGDNINGNGNWNFGFKFESQNDGTYTWSGEELGNNFKITDAANWDNGNYGSNGNKLSLGVAYVPSNGSSNNIQFNDVELVKNPKIVLTPTTNGISIVVTGDEETIDPTTLDTYLMGDFNDWAENADYLLENNNNGTWTGTFSVPASAKFQLKIGNNWYGSAGGDVDVVLNNEVKTIQLNGGLSENNYVLSDWEGGNITFDVNYEAMTVTLTPEIIPEEKNVYLIGEFSNWEVNDEYMLDNAGDGFYEASFDLNKGDQFKIMWGDETYGSDGENVYMNVNDDPELTPTEDGEAWVIATNGGTFFFSLSTEDDFILAVSYEEENPEPTQLYLVGDITSVNDVEVENGWNFANPTSLSMQEDGTWLIENVVLEAAEEMAYFAFMDMKGDWTSLENLYVRYAGSGAASTESPNKFTQNTAKSNISSTLPSGKYNFSVNFEDMTFTVEEIKAPVPTIYIIGDAVNGESNWNSTDEAYMLTYNETENNFTWKGESLAKGFKFYNGSYDEGYNIGAGEDGMFIEVDKAFTVTNATDSKNINIAEDTQIVNPEIVLDLANNTLTISGEIESTAPYVPEIILFMNSLNDWKEGFKLEIDSVGNYSGTLTLEAADSVAFKLDAGEGNWYGAVAGKEQVNLTDTVALELNATGGNWYILDWEGGDINASINWETKTMTLVYMAKDNGDDEGDKPGTGDEPKPGDDRDDQKPGEGGDEGNQGPSSGINSIYDIEEDAAIYTLQGVRVDRNKMTRGIYVINGRKVMVR